MDQRRVVNALDKRSPQVRSHIVTYVRDDLEVVAKEAAKLLLISRTNRTQADPQFRAMAELRSLQRSLLESYLKGALAQETFVGVLLASDRAFKNELSCDDFMDIDEGAVAEFVHQHEFSQSFIDAIWLHRYKLDDSEAPAFHSKIQAIIQPLQEEKVLSRSQLISSLELQSLNALGLVNQSWFQNRSKQTYTREFYEQRKYNLLREENEGFSKLLLEINQENLGLGNYKVVIENIQKLIGYFSLDPNRVLELILCAFQCNLTNFAYIELLRQFGTQHALSQLLGFKFQRIAAQGAYDCKSLFDLAALLIKHQIVDLTDIWSHFEPSTEEASEDEIEKLLQQQAKSLEYQYGMLFKTIMENNRFEEEMKGKRAEQVAIDEARSKMHRNFKLRLLQSSIDMNDWDTADEICNSVYAGKLDLTLSKDVLQSAFKAIKWLVDHLYRKIDATQSFQTIWSALRSKTQASSSYMEDGHPSSLKQATNPELLFEGLQRVLRVINVHIAFDEVAFTKVLKVINHAIQQSPEFKSLAANICGEVFFPALALTSENYHLEHLVWQIFKHADFRQRYAFYSKMLQKTYLSYPCLLAKLIMVHRECKNWASRLNSDQLRQMSKQLCKIASGNALIMFELIVSNAKSYDNMIETQIQAIANCQELSLDIMAFTITKHLADTNEDTLDDEANVSQWLNYLTKFAACFFKKYHNVEIIGLLTYLMHRQRDEDNFLLGYVLNQIIAKMFGWHDQVINQLPANQLNVIAAGFMLMLEGKNASQEVRKNNKSNDALIQLFWDSATKGHDKFAMRLMVQLAQYTQYVSNQLEEGSENLTLVSRLYDRVQVYFLHFVDTMNFLAASDKKFQLLLTESPAKTLSLDYRLPPQYVFQVLRCSLPPIYKLKPDQFNQCLAEFKKVLDYSLQSRLDVALSSTNAQENDYWDEPRFIQLRMEGIWNCIKPEIYFIFWYMSLQNLVVCEQSYKEEIKRISDMIDELKNPKQAVVSSQKTQSSSELQKKNAKEIERLTKVQKTLQKEQEGLIKNQNDTFEFLKTKLSTIFEAQPAVEANQESQGHLNDSTNAFLQYCLYPRMLHSAKDALYSFHFFKMLHRLRVPNFKILKFLIAILKCIMPAMHCCSEAEAENLGIFFLELFGLLNHWSKKAVWDKECAGYAGFAKNFGSDVCISHEEFVQIISESINKRFAVKMLCLEPSPKMYMKTRCSLIILNRMSPVFPSSYKNAETIANRLQALVDAQKQISKDLYTLASRCNEQLKAKMKTFPEYIKEQQQKEQQEKQAEEAKAKAAKKTTSSDRPASKDQRSNEKESSSSRPSEKNKTETFAQPKETKKESHGEGRDSRSKQDQGRRPAEGSRQQSDQKPSQEKAQDTVNQILPIKQSLEIRGVRQVSSSTKSVRKEDYSSAQKSSSSRPADSDRKSAPQTPKQPQRESKPSSQQSEQTERHNDLFPANGQPSKAKAKADEKQQQQSQRNQQTAERIQATQKQPMKETKDQIKEVKEVKEVKEIKEVKEVKEAPNSAPKSNNEKPSAEEVKSEQKKSQPSEPKPLTIQPRSVIAQGKDEKGRSEKSYTPQSIDYINKNPAKRPRNDNPPQRQEDSRVPPSQRDIHEVKMVEPSRPKEPVSYDHRMSNEQRSERQTPVDQKMKDVNRNEREYPYDHRENQRQEKYGDREPPGWRSQPRARSPYGYDEYEQETYYQRQVEEERQYYNQQYNRKQFQGRPPMSGNKEWVPDRPRDHSPPGKQWDYNKGYPEGEGRQRMEPKPRQPSPPQRFRPQANFTNERPMQSRNNNNNFGSGGHRQQRGGR